MQNSRKGAEVEKETERDKNGETKKEVTAESAGGDKVQREREAGL